MEVEGLADLIEARTELQRRQAILHAGGSSSAILEAWRFKLIRILARLEAAIDFVDETHVSESALEGCQAKLEALADEIEAEVERGRQGERLREGVRIVVAGLPNVGKSSLLNRLAGKDAAIVSPLPGTTRDVVEAHLNLRGIPVILQDTAGLRAAPSDAVETEGITRAGAAMRRADLVLWIMSGDVPDSWRPPTLDSEALWIWNKSDLVLPSTGDITAGPYLTVSCHTGEGFEGLQKAIVERLETLVAGGEAAVVTRQRHRDSLTATITHLRAAAKGEQPFEIITEEVRLAGQEIGRLTGFVDVEGLLDEIFAEFCIGK
jgi:tRNA modification GTPase